MRVLLLVTTTAFLAVLPATAAQASVVLVDSSDQVADAGGCGTAANPCNRIQAGVDAAAGSDTVMVAKGTYAETVVVAKSITLSGAQAGVDARDRTGVAESVVAGQGGQGTSSPCFDVTAAGVQIDGFTLQPGEYQLAAVFHPSAKAGLLANSITAAGVQLDGADATSVRGNRFQRGVLFLGQTAIANITVEGNLFGAPGGYSGIDARSASNLAVRGNTSHGTFSITNSSNVTIEDNVVTEVTTGTTWSSLQLKGDRNVLVQHNTFAKNAGDGILIGPFGATASQQVRIIGNTIAGNASTGIVVSNYYDGPSYAGSLPVHYNRIVGNKLLGVYEGTTTQDPRPVVSAEDNWWGCNEGPNRGPARQCQSVHGNIYPEPHLLLGLVGSPGAIPRAGAATLTAGLTRDSSGAAVSGEFFGDASVSFSTTSGAVTPALAPIDHGVATSILSAPDEDAIVTASATLDGATVTLPIKVGSGVPSSRPVVTGPPRATTVAPRRCVVPRLRGLAVPAARIKLKHAGCRYKVIGAGYVRSTSPAAGDQTTDVVTVQAKKRKRGRRR
jgi:hypothetical protein